MNDETIHSSSLRSILIHSLSQPNSSWKSVCIRSETWEASSAVHLNSVYHLFHSLFFARSSRSERFLYLLSRVMNSTFSSLVVFPRIFSMSNNFIIVLIRALSRPHQNSSQLNIALHRALLKDLSSQKSHSSPFEFCQLLLFFLRGS